MHSPVSHSRQFVVGDRAVRFIRSIAMTTDEDHVIEMKADRWTLSLECFIIKADSDKKQ